MPRVGPRVATGTHASAHGCQRCANESAAVTGAALGRRLGSLRAPQLKPSRTWAEAGVAHGTPAEAVRYACGTSVERESSSSSKIRSQFGTSSAVIGVSLRRRLGSVRTPQLKLAHPSLRSSCSPLDDARLHSRGKVRRRDVPM